MDPARADLRKAVSHVCYELQRVEELPAALERARAARDETAVSACFEAFFLHLRNLLEFLDAPKPRRISARNYVGPKWAIPKSDALRRLRNAREPINAHISHLLWERVTVEQNYGGGNWEISDFALDIGEVFEVFLAELECKDDEVAEWFRARLRGSVTDGSVIEWHGS